MPDYSFIAQPQVVNPMNTLGSMMDIAGKSQSLQLNRLNLEQKQQTLPADILKAQAESSTAQTGAAVAKANLPEAIKKFQAESEQARTGADAASLALKTRNQGIANGVVSSLLTNPAFIAGDEAARNHILDSSEKFLTAQGLPFGGGALSAIDQTRALIKVGVPAAAMADHLTRLTKMQATPQEQVGVQNAPVTPVSTGGAVKMEQLTPGAPGAMQPGAELPNTVGPGAVETVETGPDGNKYIVQRSPQGTILGTRALGGGQGTGQPAGGMPSYAPEDQITRPILEGERNQARNILSSAPIAHTTNRGILEELDKVIATGATGGFMAKAASIAGATGMKAPENAASAYDLIGKYTERNALEAAKAMGPGTNAGLEAAIKANGSAAYNPTALKVITKLNDAVTSGAELYQPGLERAIAANPNRGVLVKREFDQAWAQNFDTRIMELDGGSISAKSLTPAVKAELLRKAQNLRRLSVQGSL